ncbi:restriction endonuclease subunit S [Aeromonas caviae]|uniref:restriction endonuclease subunit S n=1 Tax=Aeromonas caviae TaxID=648 RepID=UPI00191E1DDB|nr:restriction endonuclease subunit S [Aeromonas caviae]MBL0553605.1 restriction endonuclease subunit S [Aeromonas caviae]
MSEVVGTAQQGLAGKYPPYPEYKDSGVTWLGHIPAQWSLKKLKYLCSIQTGNKDTVNAEDDGEYPFFVRSQTVERIGTYTADCEAVLTAGDGVGVGKVYHYYNGKFDYHQRVYMLSDFTRVTGRFVYYYLSSNFYKVALEGNAKSTVDSLRLPQFLNFEFSIPPLDTQDVIVAFLDYETARIDRLIAQQQRLIELLKEKRQAVISHAVTKGINPDAPMKDSGVEWLGQVPEHWSVIYIKHLSEVKRGASPRPIDDPKYFDEDGEYAWTRIADVSNAGMYLTSTTQRLSALGSSLSVRLNAGELFLSIAGTVGKPCITIFKSCIHDGFVYFPSLKINNKFFYYIFDAGQAYLGLGKMGTQLNLNTETVGGIKIGLPPVDEIENIIGHIEQQKEKYEKLISKASDTIELLQERRTALISAAVTGKIDLRGWTQPAEEVAA